ncbi:amino acid adenylation domain-containing protein [Streptomyces sp. NPDC088801]|uniref:amino acid adenylation domain-containing protein n=1 Tax=Streptomyces sp. NPDC088801 TaxID=3365903 RepID=UPI0038057515
MAQKLDSRHTIHGRFSERARRQPDAVAVSGGDKELTYGELERRANALAHRLLAHGVRPDEPVALLMERSPDLPVALLGILKSGAAYLPLHTRNPPARQRQVLDGAGVRVLVADRSAMPLPDTRGLTVIDPSEPADAPAAPPAPPCHGSSLAYVALTSGSTGTPKGVAVPHRNVLALVDDALWRDECHRRILMLAPHAFDVVSYEIWVPLLRGGSLALAPAGFEAQALRPLIERYAVDGLHLTAGLFRVVADCAPETFRSVREVLTGGDVVSPAAVRKVLEACPGTTVRAMYGPTEVTLFATHHAMAEPPDREVPLGRPLDGDRVYLLDEKLHPVPDGATGEIYLAGEGVARGYHGQGSLTAAAFVADPFGAPGARMYRSGDLGRRNPQGDLEFAGRIGNQVKVRGFRVEPGEIETVLGDLTQAAQVAVAAHGPDVNDKRLTAYLVPGERLSYPPDAELARRLAELLPDYMVPSAFVRLPTLPVTPNGKVDYAALPEPGPAAQADSGAPRDAREEVLAECFAEALGVERVGIHDDFFDLGGSSLSATRLLSRTRAELGVRLSMRDLLDRRTVARLAEAARAKGSRDAETRGLQSLLRIREQGDGVPLFCVHPGGGMAWCYFGLLRHLPKSVPVYGLQARGLTGHEPVAADMDALAADYVRQIRQIRPTGPYRLLGWSFGGNAAHTVAGRLRAAGEQVSLLAVLDSSHGGARGERPEMSQRDALKLAFDGLPAFDSEPGTGPIPLRRVQEILHDASSPLAGTDAPTIEAIITTTRNTIRISDAARPPHFDGDMLFFEANDPVRGPSGLAEVWRPHIGGAITSIPVSAGHMQMMTPAALQEIGPVVAARL